MIRRRDYPDFEKHQLSIEVSSNKVVSQSSSLLVSPNYMASLSRVPRIFFVKYRLTKFCHQRGRLSLFRESYFRTALFCAVLVVNGEFLGLFVLGRKVNEGNNFKWSLWAYVKMRHSKTLFNEIFGSESFSSFRKSFIEYLRRAASPHVNFR